MTIATKRRQANANNARIGDLSHMTRPRLDPLVQQTLESVGMRARKAFSDGSFRKQMTEPKARTAMGLAIASNAEIQKPLPYYHNNSAKDPWEEFRLLGQKQREATATTVVVRPPKRVRDEDQVFESSSQVLAEPNTALPASYSSTDDVNDLEFTNPPWLASQESFQSDDEMIE